MTIVKYVGLTSEAATFIEEFRRSASEPEHEIICRVARIARKATSDPGPVAPQAESVLGCDLGSGVKLAEGEQMYCFRYKSSLQNRKPEGIAVARGGSLYIGEHKIERSRGSLVQPGLRLIQQRLNDKSPTSGDFTSLDAWELWYVQRHGKLTRVGDLRPEERVQRRSRRAANVKLEELNLL